MTLEYRDFHERIWRQIVARDRDLFAFGAGNWAGGRGQNCRDAAPTIRQIEMKAGLWRLACLGRSRGQQRAQYRDGQQKVLIPGDCVIWDRSPAGNRNSTRAPRPSKRGCDGPL